jgi:NAD(P)H-hydrate epimerase
VGRKRLPAACSKGESGHFHDPAESFHDPWNHSKDPWSRCHDHRNDFHDHGSRALDGPVAEILSAAACRRLPIIAIDVPSGLMGDTGEALGAVASVLTVTFFRKKPGHLLLPGRLLCGEVVVSDIGISSSVLEQITPNTFENDPCLWMGDLPRPQDGGNKYSRGHALISGGYPMTGAARMAARAAARAGAGLTTIAVSSLALPVYAAALTSIMVQPLAVPEDFECLLDDAHYKAFLIGPGAGTGEETRARVLAMLETGRPTVLDADALTTFADDPPTLDQAIIGPCVLTPHDGEFKRLFDPSGDKLTRTQMNIVTKTTTYPLTQANQALADLRAGRFEGAAVLVP